MAPKKQAMSAAERKRKARMNKLKTMSEEEEKDFKEKERERVRKAMQNKRKKKEQEQMTSNELRDFKNSEAARMKALRNKKKKLISKQKKKQHRETAIAMLKMTASSRKNPYKTRQSFSKPIKRVRAELPASPQKQAVGLAREYGYSDNIIWIYNNQVKKFRNNSENPNKAKHKQFYYR